MRSHTSTTAGSATSTPAAPPRTPPTFRSQSGAGRRQESIVAGRPAIAGSTQRSDDAERAPPLLGNLRLMRHRRDRMARYADSFASFGDGFVTFCSYGLSDLG